MKRLAFVVVLVAVIVGIVFGGLSTARAVIPPIHQPTPTWTPHPTPTPDCCVTMWGYSGSITVPDNNATSVPYLQPKETATGPRHVVMTLDYREVQVLGQGIVVQAKIDNSSGWVDLWAYGAVVLPPPGNINQYFITLDFVADDWALIGINSDDTTFHVYYSVNVTQGVTIP